MDSDSTARVRFVSGWTSGATILSAILVLAPSTHVAGEVSRVEIHSRVDLLNGRPFGLVGGYEKLIGTVYFTLDPEDSANGAIVDLDLAPRNADGLVEFSVDLYVLKPEDSTRGNRTILFDVVNRGRKLGLSSFNRSPQSNDPTTVEDLGDGFLMEQGFTIVWIGWQFDVVDGDGRMRLEAPVATEQGSPIEGLVRYWFRVSSPSEVLSLNVPARGTVPYVASNLESVADRLTVREAILDERRLIPRNVWSFSRLEDGVLVSDPSAIYSKEGFEPGLLYEVVYQSRDPRIAGLGYAGVREAISHFRYEADSLGGVDRAYAFGASQSGRFLRGFLYEGFNADRRGRRVFDGVIAHIAGAVRSGFNRRFVQPSIVEPARFPFSDVEQTDPVTGRRDGLLSRASTSNVTPKLFLVNTSNEYWTEWKAAAMVHTSVDGTRDLELGDNVRVYTLAGAQHGAGTFPPERRPGVTRYRRNPNDYRWALRALLVAMDRWDRSGTPPPASRHPKLADGTLVELGELAFPPIPEVVVPPEVVGTYRFDDGPRFDEGIADQIPPRRGAPFPVFLPQVDEDGNEMAGIRLPEVAVPLGTYTGWNLRDPATGAPTQLARLIGSYFPFARTRAERDAIGDPRLSMEERYESRAQYLGLIAEAALELVEDGLLLGSDMPAIVRDAGEHWDYAQSR